MNRLICLICVVLMSSCGNPSPENGQESASYHQNSSLRGLYHHLEGQLLRLNQLPDSPYYRFESCHFSHISEQGIPQNISRCRGAFRDSNFAEVLFAAQILQNFQLSSEQIEKLKSVNHQYQAYQQALSDQWKKNATAVVSVGGVIIGGQQVYQRIHRGAHEALEKSADIEMVMRLDQDQLKVSKSYFLNTPIHKAEHTKLNQLINLHSERVEMFSADYLRRQFGMDRLSAVTTHKSDLKNLLHKNGWSTTIYHEPVYFAQNLNQSGSTYFNEKFIQHYASEYGLSLRQTRQKMFHLSYNRLSSTHIHDLQLYDQISTSLRDWVRENPKKKILNDILSDRFAEYSRMEDLLDGGDKAASHALGELDKSVERALEFVMDRGVSPSHKNAVQWLKKVQNLMDHHLDFLKQLEAARDMSHTAHLDELVAENAQNLKTYNQQLQTIEQAQAHQMIQLKRQYHRNRLKQELPTLMKRAQMAPKKLAVVVMITVAGAVGLWRGLNGNRGVERTRSQGQAVSQTYDFLANLMVMGSPLFSSDPQMYQAFVIDGAGSSSYQEYPFILKRMGHWINAVLAAEQASERIERVCGSYGSDSVSVSYGPQSCHAL